MFSFITTTYAWLSLSTVVSVSNIELNAKDSYDLELSLDGINYYEKIPSELILQKLANLKFVDLTSQDGLTFMGLYEGSEAPRANRDYLSLQFHFRTSNRRYTEIHLTNHVKNLDFETKSEGTYIVSRGQSFQNKVDFNYSEDEVIEAGTVRKYYASEAMRVAINSEDLSVPKIFDLSNNPTRGFGYPFGAIDYFHKNNNVELIPPNAPLVITEMSEISSEMPVALTFDSYLLSLKENSETNYYEGMIEINIWLEGWDADAFDAILKDLIKIQFEFVAVAPNELFE